MKKRLKPLFRKSLRRIWTRRNFSALAISSVLGAGASAWADVPHNTLLPGDELDLSLPCVEARLSVNPDLKTGVIIKATKGAPPDIMQSKDGTQNRLSLSYKACTQGSSLWMELSPNTTLTIHDSSGASITQEGTLAALEVNLQNASLSADTIESLDMAANGASQVTIHQLDRAAQIAAVATSKITIDQVNLTAFSATMAGTSSLQINSGLISVVTLFLSNQSMAEIHASIGKAGVTVNDQSKAKIGPLLGAILPRGTGTVETIDESASTQKPKPPAPPPEPSLSPEEQKAAAIAAETEAFLKKAATPPANPPPGSLETPSSPLNAAVKDSSSIETPSSTEATGPSPQEETPQPDAASPGQKAEKEAPSQTPAPPSAEQPAASAEAQKNSDQSPPPSQKQEEPTASAPQAEKENNSSGVSADLPKPIP